MKFIVFWLNRTFGYKVCHVICDSYGEAENIRCIINKRKGEAVGPAKIMEFTMSNVRLLHFMRKQFSSRKLRVDLS